VPDPIPFTKAIKAQIEHAGWTYNADGTVRSGFEERPDFFSSVAFWYQKGVNEELPEPPYANGRLPQGNALQIEVEQNLQDVTTDRGEASVQKEVLWSKDILFFNAQGPRSAMNVPIDVPHDGRYEVIGQIAQAPDYGDYIVTLDGKLTNSVTSTWASSDVPPPQAQIIRNYSSELYVAPDYMLGWFDLTKGRHTLTFTCVGKDMLASGYNIGIDGVVLAEVGKFDAATLAAESAKNMPPAQVPPGTPLFRGQPLIYYQRRYEQAAPEMRAFTLRLIGAFGGDAASVITPVVNALSDQDPDVQQAACWVLAQLGEKAAPAVVTLGKLLRTAENPLTRESAAYALRETGKAGRASLPDLIEALSDPSSITGSMATMAIGQMGDAGASAVPAMIEHLRAPGEEFRVKRTIIRALGKIGPPAASAIPALEEIAKQESQAVEAKAAIMWIQGKKPLTWY